MYTANISSDSETGKTARFHWCQIMLLAALLCAAPSAIAQTCITAPPNIVSWWSGESNALDNLGLNNGNPINSPTYGTGEVGTAFKFNGNNQCIRVPDSSSLHFNGQLTVEAWVFPLAYNQPASSLIVKFDGAAGVNQSCFSFSINYPQNTFYLRLSTDGTPGNAGQLNSSNTVPLNTWTHLAATYDGSTISLYINGNLDSSASYTGGVFPGTDDLGIGANVGGIAANSALAVFNGLIDEAALYNRALSAGEIQAIYAAGSAGKCPLIPAITAPPAGTNVFVGQQASFTVGVSGSQPMTYEWFFNSTNIATTAVPTLILNNVQLSQAGSYYVTVSNNVGGPVSSSSANLTVLPDPPCEPPPSNLVSWWAGEGNALDNLGTNNGTLVGSPVFANGEVGQAFSFDGATQFVRISNSPSLNFSNAMTLEAWVNPAAYSASSNAILSKFAATSGAGWSLGLFSDGTANVALTTATSSNVVIRSANVCPLNTWTHLAATYDGTNLSVYFNGSLSGITPVSGNIVQNSFDVGIGASLGGITSSFFSGMIDEASVYNRALSTTEVQAIYSAGISGKCPLPPFFVTQPTNQTVFANMASTTFTAGVGGSQPMAYEWQFNSSPIAGATNTSLTIANAQPTNAGIYSLLISNSVNSALSSNATLTVILVSTFGNGQILTNSQYTFTNSVAIRLTNYLHGSIFYTLDGSTPSAGSTLYSAPFTLTNSATIRAFGLSPDFRQSSLSTPVIIFIPPSYTLSATTAGGGSITINPAGSSFLSNTVVTLTASPSNGWTFLQWLGDAASTNLSTTVIMDRNKSAQAIFGTTVSTTFGGNGSVALNPPGGTYPFGTVLQASAVPQSGNYFVFWGDSVSGNVNPLAFPVTNATPTLSALFTTLSGGEVALAVVPVGHGTVSINPPANTYTTGTSVTITATPATNHAFLGWSGGASGTNNPLTLQLNQSETIFANFSTNHSLVLYLVTPPGTADGVAVDLLGELGIHYRLDASTNLSNWTTLYNLTNSVGTIHFIDTNAPGLNSRFYRDAILVP